MIISVEELKEYISTDKADKVLEGRLQALELAIRSYTNNNFQNQGIRTRCPVTAQKLFTDYPLFAVGDTLEISNSLYSDGIYTVKEIEGGFVALDKGLIDEPEVLVTKVEYPADVKMGVVNMLEWDLANRKKVGIQSETISRHAVTYFNLDGDNSQMGYPKSLLGFLKPYRKARF
jgi:hypothetical protein